MPKATSFTIIGKRGAAMLLSAALTIQGLAIPDQVHAAGKKQATSIQMKTPYTSKETKPTTTLYLKKGSSFRIKSTVYPKAAGKKLIYKSSKKKIAAVSQKGVIKAKKCGTAQITVCPKGNKKVKAVIRVTVVKKLKKVKKIALSPKTLSLTVGSQKKLTAQVTSPKKPTTKKMNWYTSDRSVLTVSKKGVVTAKKAGQATVTVTAADGRGAKASCRITVSEGTDNTPAGGTDTPKTSAPSNLPTSSDQPGQSASPSASVEPGTSATPDAPITIVVPGDRTGIKQGETIALTANGADRVVWSVSSLQGVSIDDTGNLSVTKEATAGRTVTVTAQTTGTVPQSATKKFTIVENATTVLTDKNVQLNEASENNPFGLTFRSDKAASIVTDPERGEVVRFDASQGYTSSSYDVLAWMVVDPAWAGKTVTISAYLKYDDSDDITGNMNLVINENWHNTNPARKYNADSGKWHHVTGTYTLPENTGKNYEGNKNRLYICRDNEHLAEGKNAVYYIDDLVFSIEKADVEKVTLTLANNATEVNQNTTLQCSAEVVGTGAPSPKVVYSIEPEVAGASITQSGVLKIDDAAIGAQINVKATSIEDSTKFDVKTVTVVEKDDFTPIVIKATLDNWWSAIDNRYYKERAYVENDGDGYVTITNGNSGDDNTRFSMPDDLRWSAVAGFLMNEDGSSIDVSDYDYLEIRMSITKSQYPEVSIYQSDDLVYKKRAYREYVTSSSDDWTWRIPLSKLGKAGVDLTDVKAISVSPKSSERAVSRVYSITFVKNTGDDYVPKNVPKTMEIQRKKGTQLDSKGSHTMGVDKTCQLVPIIKNKNEMQIDGQVTWSSEDPSIATVSDEGVVTAKKVGAVNITATVVGYENVTATYAITVEDATVATSADIQVGDYSYENYNYTLDEIKAGLDVKGVLINTFEESIGNTTEQTITVSSDSGKLGATIENGVLSVPEEAVITSSTGLATIRLALTDTDGFTGITKSISIVDGYRIPLTADAVSSAYPDKLASDKVTIEQGIARINSFTDDTDNGFRIRCALPDGKTLGSYERMMYQFAGGDQYEIYGGDTYKTGTEPIDQGKITSTREIFLLKNLTEEQQKATEFDFTYLIKNRNAEEIQIHSVILYKPVKETETE